jgi:hypothetical protein
MLGQPGTTVTISGGGFGPGSTVTFGGDSPVPPASIASDGTSLVVVVRPTSTSGPLVVTTPAGATSGTPFAIDNYRNTRGYMAVNQDVMNLVGGNWTFNDATVLFGSSQTNWTFIITEQNWFVYVFLAIVNPVLDTAGLCFGMSLSSQRFISGEESYGLYDQQPAAQLETDGPPGPNVWQLNGPPGDQNTGLPNYIRWQHLAQFSVESINNYIGQHNPFASWSAANLRSTLQNAFANGMGALVAVSQRVGVGHVLVAYQIVDDDNGDFDILVYNCNVPFTVAEDSNSSATQSAAILAASNSKIHVTSGGTWTIQPFAAGTNNQWTGGMSGITVTSWETIPNQPTAPFNPFEVAVLAGMVILIALGAASVTQVSDGNGHLLFANGEWNTDPTTALAGVAPMPNCGGLSITTPTPIVSNVAGPLTHTVTGNAAGSYDFNWLGKGQALTLAGVSAAAGSSDTVVADPIAQKVDFTPSSDKALNATLIGTGTTSKLPRKATLNTTASANAAVSLSFDPGAETFSYTHAGAPTSYTLQLSSLDATGAATTFTTAPAPVATGDNLTFTPDWTQLATGVGTVLRTAADGTVVSSTLE